MLVSNLVTSLRFLGIGQDFATYCVKKKQICSTSPPLVRCAMLQTQVLRLEQVSKPYIRLI